jgi:hypothetical protein
MESLVLVVDLLQELELVGSVVVGRRMSRGGAPGLDDDDFPATPT